jgi:primosomal protein N'
MYYYQILPSRKIPQIYLTYSSEMELGIGQLVEINIRGGLTQAIVIREISEVKIEFDKSKIKPISEVYNFRFDLNTLGFLKIFSQNTFNSINLSLSPFLQPLKLITQKQWKSLSESNYKSHILELSEKTHLPTQKTEFLLDISITLRIIYIIRSAINIDTSNTLLIIFPEKKFLNKILGDVLENPEYKKMIKDKVEIYNYSGDVNKKSKDTIWNLINPENESLKPKVIFSTRAGLFLPFQNLKEIVLVDEANSMHIQDQNSIYFDTRDAVFLLANAHQAHLSFLSTLPSIRLYNFYPENIMNQLKI